MGIIILLASAAAIAIAFGALWEQYERRRVAREFPAPGRLVDIGGRRIQLDCRGTGSPMVVFESGLDLFGSTSWARVHDEVAKFTRACAYSRAGIAWSDRKKSGREGASVARDLHAALEAAGENGPLLLVGHSLGGPYITLYTKLFGDQVAGLVYVDASHPDQVQRMAAATGKPMPTLPVAVMRVAASLSWTGLIRLGATLMGCQSTDLPSEAEKVDTAFASQSFGPLVQELGAVDAVLAEAGTFRHLGDRPVAVLTAMKPLPEDMLNVMGMTAADGEKMIDVWRELHNDMASWSSRSTHQTFDDASHYIQFDRPDAVIAAIRQVAETVRADGSR